MSFCSQSLLPPDVAKKPYKMILHGDTRVDNYHWMRLSDEQKSAKSYDEKTTEVVDYISRENEYTQTSLSHTKKFQNKLYNEIVGRIKKDDKSVPYFENGYYYYTRYEKNKEYAIHCRKKVSLEVQEEILIDENKLAKGYDYFALSGRAVSPDNNWLAYGIDTLSRRFYEIYFKNLITGEVLNKTIPNTTGSIAWANDNKTIFYTSKNKVTLISEKIYSHKVGSDPEKDIMVYKEDDITYYTGVYRSKSGEYIIIWNSSTLVSDYHILRTDNPDGNFVNFTPRGTKHEYSIEHFGDKFYIVTNQEAENNRLMETPEDATDISNWKEIISHRNDVHLLAIEIFNNYLVVNERKDGLRELRVINQSTGEDYYIDFGEKAYTAWISINREFNTRT